ncbi:hypothetical protein H257_19177 [Aphanomyces astaci]|nr:hypothetical protein H257_19177 [Aphanomyces astaci]ETV63892.1 hypothetical protein H257_19177 [Aphanomyces astaci]|eukprot:XP_009846624.1 hypothetical protein H257_19177 [Aphanomyces astaci]
MDPFAVVNRLQQDIEDENINLEEMSQVYRKHTQQVEDTNDSPKPLIDRFYLQGGNVSLTTMMNLTLSEFESIWAVVESSMETTWTLGCGHKSTTSPKDALDIEMKAPTFEKMIHGVIGVVESVL